MNEGFTDVLRIWNGKILEVADIRDQVRGNCLFKVT